METDTGIDKSINAQELSEILFKFHSILEEQAQAIESLKLSVNEKDVAIKKVHY